MRPRDGVMMQLFHWYSPADGSFWDAAARRAPDLRAAGFDAVWLPPAYKGEGGAAEVGYAAYDLYDLGEFDQKGTVRTKYGTRDQYVRAIRSLQAAGVSAYADVVLNHRTGADGFEEVLATPYPADDRRQPSGPPRVIQAATKFAFPGRSGKYSDFAWGHQHFDGCDYDRLRPDDTNTVYLFDGKSWDGQVSEEYGSYAFLLGSDLDFESEEVGEEVARWGRWLLDTTGVDGFRFDAAKHISASVFPKWLARMEAHAGRELFGVAEYWSGEVENLHTFLNDAGPRVAAFDVPLHWAFHRASQAHGHYDMRRIFADTLVQQRPGQAVTFTDNHDSQPLQALESAVEPWFVPLAYALILLRRDGAPCVFAPDYDGAEYEDAAFNGERRTVKLPSHRHLIDIYLRARREFNHGEQLDYFDHWNRVGWVRLGDAAHPKAMAVLLSDGPEGTKFMQTHRPPGTRFYDLTGHAEGAAVVGPDGRAEFRCRARSVSVWVQE